MEDTNNTMVCPRDCPLLCTPYCPLHRPDTEPIDINLILYLKIFILVLLVMVMICLFELYSYQQVDDTVYDGFYEDNENSDERSRRWEHIYHNDGVEEQSDEDQNNYCDSSSSGISDDF